MGSICLLYIKVTCFLLIGLTKHTTAIVNNISQTGNLIIINTIHETLIRGYKRFPFVGILDERVPKECTTIPFISPVFIWHTASCLFSLALINDLFFIRNIFILISIFVHNYTLTIETTWVVSCDL